MYKVVFRGGNGWPVTSYYEKKCFAISAAMDRGPSDVYEKIGNEWRKLF